MAEITPKTSSQKSKVPPQAREYDITYELIYYRLLYRSFTFEEKSLVPDNTYFNLHIKDNETFVYIINKNDTDKKIFTVTHLIKYDNKDTLNLIEIKDDINYDDVQFHLTNQPIKWGDIINILLPENMPTLLLKRDLILTKLFCKNFSLTGALSSLSTYKHTDYSCYIRFHKKNDDDDGILIFMGRLLNFNRSETEIIEMRSEEITYGIIIGNDIQEYDIDQLSNKIFTGSEHIEIMEEQETIIKNMNFKDLHIKFIISDSNKKKVVILPKKEEEKKKESEIEEKKEYKPGFISIPRNKNKLHRAKLTHPYGKRRAEVLITASNSENKIIGRAHKISYVSEHGTEPNKVWAINYLNKNNKIAYYDVIYNNEDEIASFIRRQNKTFLLSDWNKIYIEINILKNNEVYNTFSTEFTINEENDSYDDLESGIIMDISQYKTSVSLWSIKYIVLQEYENSRPDDDTKPIFNY